MDEDVPHPTDVCYLSHRGTCCEDFTMPALNVACFMESQQKVRMKSGWAFVYCVSGAAEHLDALNVETSGSKAADHRNVTLSKGV